MQIFCTRQNCGAGEGGASQGTLKKREIQSSFQVTMIIEEERANLQEQDIDEYDDKQMDEPEWKTAMEDCWIHLEGQQSQWGKEGEGLDDSGKPYVIGSKSIIWFLGRILFCNMDKFTF